jgi:hypothetical protein
MCGPAVADSTVSREKFGVSTWRGPQFCRLCHPVTAGPLLFQSWEPLFQYKNLLALLHK